MKDYDASQTDSLIASDAEHDAAVRRNSSSLQQTPPKPSYSGVAVLSLLVHVLAAATFVCVLVLILKYYAGDEPLKFGDFGLHPVLMVTAFGLLSPIAAVTYKTYESVLGLSHAAAKGLY